MRRRRIVWEPNGIGAIDETDKAWNKVLIMIVTNSGRKLPLNYIALASYTVGAEVMAETSGGARRGVIKEIVETNVTHRQTHKAVSLIDTEETDMLKTMFAVAKVAKTNSQSTRIDYFYIPRDLVVDEGNIVVYACDYSNTCVKNNSSVHLGDGMHVGVVETISKPGTFMGTVSPGNFIVDVVNTKDAMLAVNTAKQAYAIKAQLDTRKKMFEQKAIYEMLAEKDAEASNLMEQLKILGGI